MKEFLVKHPIVSLFMLDIAVSGVLKGIALIKGNSCVVVVKQLQNEDTTEESTK